MENQQVVFLSYTTKDRDRVVPFYEYLISNGISAWIDFKCLRAGQNWDFEIRRALQSASIIIVFVSNNSVSKRGYVQRELKYALDRLKEKMIDDIYVLPVLLDDDVRLPNELSDVQHTSASSEQCFDEIKNAINDQLERLGSEVGPSEGGNATVRWSFMKYRDSGDGLPGFDVDYRIPALSSTEFSRLNEITDIVRGDCTKALMNYRSAKFNPQFNDFNYGQPRWMRTNTFSATCTEPVVTGRCIGITCVYHYYYARAAHPNMEYRTYSFILEPLFMISDMRELLNDSDKAFPIIIKEIRRILFENIAEGSSDDNAIFYKETIEQGTSSWDQLANFVLLHDGVEFLFPPYQVASYADGPQSAKVSYEIIAEFISDSFLYALDLSQYIWKKNEQIAETPASAATSS